MPLYDYACTKCGHVTEVRHGFDETYDTPCEACGAPVRRVFNAAPILFKGSGFYVTDSRKSSGGGKTTTSKSESTASKSDAKPAADANASSDTKSSSDAKTSTDTKKSSDSAA